MEHLYTALFCEENIWHLANSLIKQGVPDSELSVVFISNKHQQTAIFNQQSAKPNHPVIWDYHVVLLKKSSTECLIYDFDSRSKFPSVADDYLTTSFPDETRMPDEYQARFRLIDAQTYIRLFSSDRSHMQGILAPEKHPKYKPMTKPETTERITLAQFIDFNSNLEKSSSLMTKKELIKFISA